MAKKSKQHPRNRKVAKPGARQTATASEAAADVAPTAVEPAPAPSTEGDVAPEAPVVDPSNAEAVGAESRERAKDEGAPTDIVADAHGAEARTTGQKAQDDQEVDAAQTVLPFESALDDETAASDAAPGDQPASLEGSRLESIIESLLFASNKALGVSELKRLLGERDGKKIAAAVETLMERRKGSGIQVVALSSGWHLRTHVENAAWVSKLLAGKPVRLSRAMMETLAIVAYRQPVTRPEIDDIRGVDCGPVLGTLLDRGLVRIIGKKEEVGRPLLYGTTPEFLRLFNLRDLSELPTLREFYDLSAEDQSRVDAEHGKPTAGDDAATAKLDVALASVPRGALAPEPEDTDPLLDELDEASRAAKHALGHLDVDQGEDKTEEPEGKAAAEPGSRPGPPAQTSE
jgi:segregation and condensation protein B